MVLPLLCAPYPKSFFIPPLSFMKPDQFFKEQENLWNWIDSVSVITIMLSFSWMFTERSIYFYVKTRAVPIKADWRRVNCDHGHKNDLSENQEYLKKQQQKERKDNKLPQEYMWAPLFPNYLLDIQHIQEQESSAELLYTLLRTFVQICLSPQ